MRASEGASQADDGVDEQLLERLRTGDALALRALMERYRRPLHGYLCRMLASPDDADDLFQEVFLRVLRHAQRFERGRRVRPWVYSIATNLVKNSYRARSYRQAASLDQSRDLDDDGAPLAAALAGREGLPAEALLREETRERVRDAVAALPEKGRAALVLYYFQGLPYDEVAASLDVPLGTVKSRIHNALVRLEQALSKEAAR